MTTNEAEGKVRSKKLQDILNMTMKLKPEEMQDFKHTEIDPERKAWFNAAVEQMMENDDSKMLMMVTQRLLQYKAGDTLSEEQLTELDALFDELNYLLEGFDVAISFDNLGGLKHTVSLLKSTYSFLQWRAADVIANSVQNKEKLQNSVIEVKGMETLLYTLKKSDVDMVRVKCLYALSSLLGGNSAAEKLFIDLKGINVLVKLLNDDYPKVRIKSIFLLRKIIIGEMVEFVCNKTEITSNFITLLKLNHDDSHEFVADVLLTLLEIDTNSLDVYRAHKNELTDVFTRKKKELQETDIEKYEELIDKYEKLCQLF